MISNEMYLEIKGKWKSLYPIYFDSSKTIQQGRRVSQAQGVKEPTPTELAAAVSMCQLRNFIQPHKCYSRDYFQMGRLKVELNFENGKPVHVHIPNKKKLMTMVAKNLQEMRKK